MDVEHPDVGIPIGNSDVGTPYTTREQVGQVASRSGQAASGTLALPSTVATPIGNRERAGTLALPPTAAETAAQHGEDEPAPISESG